MTSRPLISVARARSPLAMISSLARPARSRTSPLRSIFPPPIAIAPRASSKSCSPTSPSDKRTSPEAVRFLRGEVKKSGVSCQRVRPLNRSSVARIGDKIVQQEIMVLDPECSIERCHRLAENQAAREFCREFAAQVADGPGQVERAVGTAFDPRGLLGQRRQIESGEFSFDVELWLFVESQAKISVQSAVKK